MTKQQLIEKVAAKTELRKAEVEVVEDSVLDLVAETLRFKRKDRPARGLAASWRKREGNAKAANLAPGGPSPSPQNEMQASSPVRN